ncbi:MAG: gephyrin-like molybdotransferase Glp [Thermoleophilaceae bacterium]
MSDLITIEEARRRVLATVTRLGDEPVALDAALGRVLAEEVSSTLPVPPFDSSAMDGFAVVAGPAAELSVVGEARAGHPYSGRVEPGSAVRISTGAVLPEGADAVVPVERTAAVKGAGSGDGVDFDPVMRGKGRHDRVSVPGTESGENVRRAGEDIPLNAVVLHAGALIGPAELGVAASVGKAELRCGTKPRVAVLVTGDELTEPGAALAPGGIYSSNAYALAAQVERAGGVVVARARVPDQPEGTRAALERALDQADVVVVSGGVSVGPHDHVKPALRDLGVEERFWGVRLRPGKPTWFGARGSTLAFGLPGNPVSAMITFQLFARPALAALQGAAPDARRVAAVLESPIPRNTEREQAIRVRLLQSANGLTAAPTKGAQGSHVLTSMVGADGLALIAAGPGNAPGGERVEVVLL